MLRQRLLHYNPDLIGARAGHRTEIDPLNGGTGDRGEAGR